MNNIIKYSNNNKATVCTGKACVTVYGEVAKRIEQIVLCATVVIAVAAIVKAFR
jgi:hypothetical protein